MVPILFGVREAHALPFEHHLEFWELDYFFIYREAFQGKTLTLDQLQCRGWLW